MYAEVSIVFVSSNVPEDYVANSTVETQHV